MVTPEQADKALADKLAAIDIEKELERCIDQQLKQGDRDIMIHPGLVDGAPISTEVRNRVLDKYASVWRISGSSQPFSVKFTPL